MDWDTYYEKFYDWAPSTQISRLSSLTSFGPSSEIAEIAQNFTDEQASSRLIKKAVAYGVQFTSDEIYDLSGCCNTEAMNALLLSSKCKFTKEQLEDIWGTADDDILEKVAAKNKIVPFEEYDEPDLDEGCCFDKSAASEPKPEFLSKLFMAIGSAAVLSSKPKHRHGHCNGDCAHCPPHYGYRYGRWYYGHGHTYGCEFGGNKGDG